MKFAILGQPMQDAHPSYRGLDRETPTFVEYLPEAHPVNQAFLWYAHAGVDGGLVDDMVQAQAAIAQYAVLTPPQYFELIEVTMGAARPNMGTVLLGYDIVAGYYSVLSWGLTFQETSTLPPAINTLTDLLGRYFRPRLNIHSLFANMETAQYCLACMEALQTFHPGLWEHERVQFAVVGLWQVVAEV